eukprot:comp19157_c0_seq1/m.21835 comp19157_c0_seq1/g.21835  ORF comp19157_c0_seq1/g.21835 comp19157_c0_seq1/m.21835 type:complete len:107 (-) comp19157_c0_seq1:513-833(-)
MSGAVSQAVQAFIKQNPVAIFSKQTCPFCIRVKDTFSGLGVQYKAMELDVEDNGSAIQSELLKLTGQRTVPNVFVHGKHIGGCDDTLAALRSGRLGEMLGLKKTQP